MADSKAFGKLKLTVLTPAKRVVEALCDNVYFPTSQGIIGVLPGHIALVCEVGTGVLHFDHDNQTAFLSVSGGVAEVRNDEVNLIVDIAEDAAGIDVGRAERALQKARELLGGRGSGTDEDLAKASEAEARALARLNAANRQNEARR